MAKSNTKEKSAQVRMDQELFDKAVVAAKKLDRSFASYVRMLIQQDLEK